MLAAFTSVACPEESIGGTLPSYAHCHEASLGLSNYTATCATNNICLSERQVVKDWVERPGITIVTVFIMVTEMFGSYYNASLVSLNRFFEVMVSQLFASILFFLPVVVTGTIMNEWEVIYSATLAANLGLLFGKMVIWHCFVIPDELHIQGLRIWQEAEEAMVQHGMVQEAEEATRADPNKWYKLSEALGLEGVRHVDLEHLGKLYAGTADVQLHAVEEVPQNDET